MKTWNMRKKKDAVSPVIATILMVAITVVLAAVLYVMVMGFGGDTTSTPTASLTKDGNHLVLSISESEKISDGTLYVRINDTTTYAMKLGLIGSGTASVYFVDAGGDGVISTGDYFNTTAAASGVTISLLYKSGDTNTPIADGIVP